MALLGSAREKWSSLGPRWRQFLVSVAVGVGIEFVFLSCHHHPWIVSLEDHAIDVVNKVHRGTLPPGPESPPFVLLDIDQETYRRWGRPDRVPRDKLAELIRYALGAPPAVLLVDVDLRHPSERGDDELVRLLASLDGSQPPVVLTRSLASDPTGPASFLDEALGLDPARGAPERGIHWGSSVFPREPDWSIRRWSLWDHVCVGDRPRPVVGMPLLAALLLQPGDAARTLEALEHLVPLPRDPICGGAHAMMPHPVGEWDLAVGGLQLHVPPSSVQQRIIYRMPWRLLPGERWPRLPTSGRPLMEVIPAHEIVGVRDASPELLRDAVVLIGGSYVEGRDIHPTPLGEMPGSMIIANSVSSVLTYGQLELPSPWIRGLVLLLSVVLVSAIFTLFTTFWGLVTAVGMIVLVLLPLSAYVFRAGIWLDFAAPILGVALHDIWAQFEESRHQGGHS